MNAYLRTVDRRSDALGQLGDLVCVEGDCKAGEAAVAQMKGFYDALTAKAGAWYTDPALDNIPQATRTAIAQKYGAAVAGVIRAENDLETWARRWVPFHPNCCAIKDVGVQAQDLTQRMAVDAGIAAPPKNPGVQWTSTGGILGNAATAVWGLAKLAILVGGGLYAYKQLADAPARKRS